MGEIAARLHIRQPQVSKHLRVLSDAPLVEVHPSAQQRIYRLRTAPFQALDVWLESYRIKLPSDREIVMTRMFNEPRELIFKALVDPTLISQWWGLRAYTTITAPIRT